MAVQTPQGAPRHEDCHSGPGPVHRGHKFPRVDGTEGSLAHLAKPFFTFDVIEDIDASETGPLQPTGRRFEILKADRC